MNPKLTILCESGDAVVDHKTNILNLMWKRSIDKWKKAIGVNRKQHVVHIMNPIEFQEKPVADRCVDELQMDGAGNM